jgi:hypothetical protein
VGLKAPKSKSHCIASVAEAVSLSHGEATIISVAEKMQSNIAIILRHGGITIISVTEEMQLPISRRSSHRVYKFTL